MIALVALATLGDETQMVNGIIYVCVISPKVTKASKDKTLTID